MEKMSLIYSTFPDKEIADNILRSLIEQKIAACGNVWQSSSMYTWNGGFMQEGEYCSFIKTLPFCLEKCLIHIKKLHPYDVPCILTWETNVNTAYFEWLESVLTR